MSLCLRTISTKLPSTFSTRKQMTQFDRRFQNVSQSKINDTLLFTSSDWTLNESKMNVPLRSNHIRSCLNNKLFMLKMQHLKDNCYTKEYKTQTVSSLSHFSNYKNSFHQSNGLIIFNHSNYLRNVYLFSTQTKVELKENNSEEFKKNIFDDLDDNHLKQSSSADPSREGRPSLEQLENIKIVLSHDLPLFFVQFMDYNIYTSDVVFENNIRGTTTKGFFMYYVQLILLKVIGHLKFIYVKFHIIKITTNPEDDSIKVRWRITGISGAKIFTRFFTFKNPFRVRDTINREQENWYDGFSTYYVNNKGKVYKHVVDKIMPDNDQVDVEKKIKIPVKLAICFGISNLDFLLSDVCTKV